MKYALFLGCTIPARSRNYEMSVRKVAEKLGIELVDLPDFACCGFPVKSVDWHTCLALAARNLAVAETAGLEVCALCSACASVLTECSKKLDEDIGLRQETNRRLAAVGRAYNGGVKVKHFARMLYEDVGVDTIKSKVIKNLDGLKIASHYGCHYLKPSSIYDDFDSPEFPSSLDTLVSATGASPVDYVNEKRCCGGGVLAVDEHVALSLASKKLDDIKGSGADAINLVCPFCAVMYDDNQKKVEAMVQSSYALPVLYYPQLLGLAMGIDPGELGLNINKVKTRSLLERL